MTEQASSQDEGTQAAPNSAVTEIKAQLDRLAIENARLLGRLDQIDRSASTIARQPTPVAPPMTPEAYNNLLKTDAKEAVKLAVAEVVQDQVRPMMQNVQAQNQKERWDAKVATDFPALASDRDFQGAVQDQMAEMIQTDGLSKDHPTLLYRATQIAAAKLGKSGKLASREGGSGSGEAPRSGGGSDGGKFKLPGYYEDFNKVFGVKDEKSKARLAAKLEAASKPQQRRR